MEIKNHAPRKEQEKSPEKELSEIADTEFKNSGYKNDEWT